MTEIPSILPTVLPSTIAWFEYDAAGKVMRHGIAPLASAMYQTPHFDLGAVGIIRVDASGLVAEDLARWRVDPETQSLIPLPDEQEEESEV